MKQYLANTLLGVLFLGGMMALYPTWVTPGWERSLWVEMRRANEGGIPMAFTTSAYTTFYLVPEGLGRIVDKQPREELRRALLAMNAENPKVANPRLIEICLAINKIGHPYMRSYATWSDGKKPERRYAKLQYNDSAPMPVIDVEAALPETSLQSYSFFEEAFENPPVKRRSDYTDMTLIGP